MNKREPLRVRRGPDRCRRGSNRGEARRWRRGCCGSWRIPRKASPRRSSPSPLSTALVSWRTRSDRPSTWTESNGFGNERFRFGERRWRGRIGDWTKKVARWRRSSRMKQKWWPFLLLLLSASAVRWRRRRR